MPIKARNISRNRAVVDCCIERGTHAWSKAGRGREPIILSTASVSGTGVNKLRGMERSTTALRQVSCSRKGVINVQSRRSRSNDERWNCCIKYYTSTISHFRAVDMNPTIYLRRGWDGTLMKKLSDGCSALLDDQLSFLLSLR